MDRHIPQAVADYRRLYDLDVTDGARADTTKIKHSDVTGKQALLEVLKTINTQFDDLLNASYHQDGQNCSRPIAICKHALIIQIWIQQCSR